MLHVVFDFMSAGIELSLQIAVRAPRNFLTIIFDSLNLLRIIQSIYHLILFL